MRVTSNGTNVVDYAAFYFFRQTVVERVFSNMAPMRSPGFWDRPAPRPANLLDGYTIDYTAKLNTDPTPHSANTWHIDVAAQPDCRRALHLQDQEWHLQRNGRRPGLDLTGGLPAPRLAATDQALKNAFGVSEAYSTKEDNGAVWAWRTSAIRSPTIS